MQTVKSRLELIIAMLAAAGALGILYASPLYAVSVQQQNEYVYVKLGVRGTCGDQWDISGRWTFGTVLGDPDPANTADDNRALTMSCSAGPNPIGEPAQKFAYTTIRVDGDNLIFGDPDDGAWEPEPYVGTPPYDGLTGFYLMGKWRTKENNIFVKHKLSIIRDQIRLEYTITNQDPANPHTVGLRLQCDVLVDNTDTVAFPFIPGRGIYLSETDLSGSSVPEFFEIYDDQFDPKVIVRNILRGEDATPPDRIAIGEWSNLVSSDWDFTAIPDRTVRDHAWALWWNEQVLQPNQSRTIVTYVGLGTATASWTSGTPRKLDPYVVAVSSPRALEADVDRDGSLPDFDIKAYVYNLYHDIDLQNVQLHLTLPEGLETSDPAIKQIEGGITRETEGGPATWRVKATGEVSGPVEYMVSVSGSAGLQKTIRRSIVLSASFDRAVDPGWQLISVPFELKDGRPEFALLPYSSTDEEMISGLQALRWDSASNDYVQVTAIKPGQGFWLKFDDPQVAKIKLKRPGSALTNAIKLPDTQTTVIDLTSGWNQFGNPYLFPIIWGRVKVLNSSQVGPVSIEEAANRNWIRRTIYWYDVGRGEYLYSSSPLAEIRPWMGYWIKALTPCQLIIPPVEMPGAVSTSPASASSRAALAAMASAGQVFDGWKLDLRARSGTSAASGVIGLDSRASDGYSIEDVERPPSLANYVALSFPHRDWGVNSGGYIQDVRRSGGDKVWEMEVLTDKKDADVILTWPGIGSVPKTYSLKLEDLETGVRKDMRTTSSYRFNTGSSTARRFRIIAESTGRGRLLITGLTVKPSRATGTATVSYSLSTDAVSDVRVRNASGATVANLASGTRMTRGIASIAWNYRNHRGEPVPAGSYIVEVVATTPEGEVAKAVVPFIVAR